MRNKPSPDSGKSKREQSTAEYVREGKAKLLLTTAAPCIRAFKHPELPEGRYCLLADYIAALWATGHTLTKGLTGDTRPVVEMGAAANVQLGVVSVVDAPAYPGSQALLDPRLSATEQANLLTETVRTVHVIKEAYASNPALTIEEANAIVENNPHPDKVRALLGGLKTQEYKLHMEGGGAIIIPSTKDLPKSLESRRDHVVLARPAGGFDDDQQQASVTIVKVEESPDAERSILREGMHLRINCSSEEHRAAFLLAQATRSHFRLTLSVPAVPLVHTMRSVVICSLLQFELVRSDDSAKAMQQFQQLALDFGVDI